MWLLIKNYSVINYDKNGCSFLLKHILFFDCSQKWCMKCVAMFSDFSFVYSIRWSVWSCGVDICEQDRMWGFLSSGRPSSHPAGAEGSPGPGARPAVCVTLQSANGYQYEHKIQIYGRDCCLFKVWYYIAVSGLMSVYSLQVQN